MKLSAKLCCGIAVLIANSMVNAEEFSPGVRQHDYPQQLLWGDTHLHTNMSADAFMENNRTLSPADAFRFARGEVVTSASGVKAALKTPLDFLVVSDHAEFIGMFAGVVAADNRVLKTELGKRWHEYYQKGDMASMFKEFQGMVLGRDADQETDQLKADLWQDMTKTADRFNQPGHFSAIIGYEWSSTPAADNLHRVVVYKGDSQAATRMLPFSAVDSKDPEDLWKFMEQYEQNSGDEILAIPHNGNLSNGLMFAPSNYSGEPLTKGYAARRQRWEPIYEVTQIKGDGETHPKLSPDDEFADYETWDTGNFPVGDLAKVKTDAMLPFEYARSALKLGLQHEQQLGINPFKFGMVGSTDAHTSLSAVEEDNFFGKFVESEPNAERLNSNMKWLGWPNNMITASGLAAVWATENTRESIFAAMKRREVYATTGSRISVRFFAGWDFSQSDIESPDYVNRGYSKGVPMGSELSQAPTGKAPSFLISASKDPNEANLDRVQVIKGWLDKDGELHEKIYEVAASDQRTPDSNGKLTPLPSTVDRATATYLNSVGAVNLSTAWQDPDFDPSQPAFYYLRVIEIAKPRWTSMDAKHFNTAPRAGTIMETQDRAYSSPIWYQP